MAKEKGHHRSLFPLAWRAASGSARRRSPSRARPSAPGRGWSGGLGGREGGEACEWTSLRLGAEARRGGEGKGRQIEGEGERAEGESVRMRIRKGEARRRKKKCSQ